MSIWKKLVIGGGFLILFAVAAVGQESLNSFYSYPVSVGIGYHPLSPVGEVLRRATVNDISGRVRIPLPFMPALQPFVLGGMVTYDSDEADDPTIRGGVLDADAAMPDYNEQDTWDHRNIFGGLGVGYAHRMTKEFEIGAEVYGGPGDVDLAAGGVDGYVADADGSGTGAGGLFWRGAAEDGLDAGD